MISLVDRFEKTCQLNQNFRELLRMRHSRNTVPLNYKHLCILFTLQVALFRVVSVVGIGDFFNVESVKTDIL